MENGQSCSLPLPSLLTISPSPNPAGYFTASHHLTSYCLIRPLYFLALLAQNRPSTVCQELAAAVASSAGSSLLARSLGWHGSSILAKWRPCRCRLDAGRLASSLWTAVSEGSVKLGDEAVPGYQRAGSAEGRLHVWVAQNQSTGAISICFQPLD